MTCHGCPAAQMALYHSAGNLGMIHPFLLDARLSRIAEESSMLGSTVIALVHTGLQDPEDIQSYDMFVVFSTRSGFG